MTKMWEKFGNNKNTIWQIVSQKGLGGIMKVSGRAKVLNYCCNYRFVWLHKVSQERLGYASFMWPIHFIKDR